MSPASRSSAGSQCPLCASRSGLYRSIDGVDYLNCVHCDFIFADPVLLEQVDAGIPLRSYDAAYWNNEMRSARERSYGSSMARLAEAILYCRIGIEQVVDIGTGPGYLLDAVAMHLPSKALRFYGVEKFPPQPEFRSSHPNYRCADLADLGIKFQCGVCVEVLEHLTPRMAKNLAGAIRSISVEGSLFLFNTGLTDYVRNEDPDYLDPKSRGHITCWSVKAARRIFGPLGFQVYPLLGRSWAFVIERTNRVVPRHLEDRVWSAPASNVELLRDDASGSSVLYLLGRESARLYAAEAHRGHGTSRSAWSPMAGYARLREVLGLAP